MSRINLFQFRAHNTLSMLVLVVLGQSTLMAQEKPVGDKRADDPLIPLPEDPKIFAQFAPVGPERPIRYISLKEAIAIALESGVRCTVPPEPTFIEFGIYRSFNLPDVKRVEKFPTEKIRAFAIDKQTKPATIVICRNGTKRPRAEFEREIDQVLFSVEQAYWLLYEQNVALYSVEMGIRQCYLTWQMTQKRFHVGTATIEDVAQVRAVFENYCTQRSNAIANVQDADRLFRALLGLPEQDGTHLMPVDIPSTAAYTPDYDSALKEAFASRPNLIALRKDIEARQLRVMQVNIAAVCLGRLLCKYNIFLNIVQSDGLTEALIREDPRYNVWSAGGISFPFSGPPSGLRTTKLGLARAYINLRNQETKMERVIAGLYQAIHRYHGDIEANFERRKALAVMVRRLFSRDVGIRLLQAQMDFQSAFELEYQAIRNFNIAIAAFHYWKGSIRQYHNVVIAEDRAPDPAMCRAVDYFQKQTAEQIAAERKLSLSSNEGNSLPRLLEHRLPTPRSLKVDLDKWRKEIAIPGN